MVAQTVTLTVAFPFRAVSGSVSSSPVFQVAWLPEVVLSRMAALPALMKSPVLALRAGSLVLYCAQLARRVERKRSLMGDSVPKRLCPYWAPRWPV